MFEEDGCVGEAPALLLCYFYNLLQANLLLHTLVITDLSPIHVPEEHRKGSINALL